MNTLKRGSLSKIYIVVLILVIGYVLYNIGGSLITSDYKYKDFLNDMKNKNVSEITIKQNKEIPTGKIIVKLKNDETKSIYVSDVNKVSDDIEEINNNVGTDIRPYLERSEEHTSELQSPCRISYAVFCLHPVLRLK